MSREQDSTGLRLMGAGTAFRAEVCDMIASTQLFADFEWKDVEALATYVQCYEVTARTTIFREGEAGSYLCVLVQGEMEIFKDDHAGQPRRIVTISRGKTVGEMSIIDGEPRSATCIAREHSVLLLLTKDNYAKIIRDRPVLAVHILAKLARLMSQRLRGVSGQLVEYLDHDRA